MLASVSLSYSDSAVGTALVVEAAAFETAICRGTRGWISEGAEGPDELENNEPPRSGFLLEARDLSTSAIRIKLYGSRLGCFKTYHRCVFL